MALSKLPIFGLKIITPEAIILLLGLLIDQLLKSFTSGLRDGGSMSIEEAVNEILMSQNGVEIIDIGYLASIYQNGGLISLLHEVGAMLIPCESLHIRGIDEADFECSGIEGILEVLILIYIRLISGIDSHVLHRLRKPRGFSHISQLGSHSLDCGALDSGRLDLDSHLISGVEGIDDIPKVSVGLLVVFLGKRGGELLSKGQ